MMAVFEPSNLSVLDVENLRLHYAQTLRHWLARFEAAVDRVSLENHLLAKRAKDIGSAAVFISLVNVPVVWLIVLFG